MFVSPKAVDPVSFSGDHVHIVFPLHLFHDHHPYLLTFVIFLLEVVGRFSVVLSSQICSMTDKSVHHSILRLAYINHLLTSLTPHTLNRSHCSAVHLSFDSLSFSSFIHYFLCIKHKFTQFASFPTWS